MEGDSYWLLVIRFQIYLYKVNRFSMKVRKKLMIDNDRQVFSPESFLKSVDESENTLEFQQKKTKQKYTFKDGQQQMISQYILSIKQPSRACQNSCIAHNNQRQTKKYNTNRRKSSVSNNHFSHLTLDREKEITFDRQITLMKEEVVRNKKNKSCKLFFQNNNILQELVKTQKVQKLTKNFVKKLRRCSTLHETVQYQKIKSQQNSSLLYLNGLQLSPVVDSIFSFLSVIQILTLLVIYTLSIIFSNLTQKYSFISILQTGSLAFYFIQICINFVTVKFSAGKKLSIIKEIIHYYISQNFLIDFISFIILFIDITASINIIIYFRLFILFKLPQCLEKIQKIQVYFIKNIYNEQYWELVKVFLVNFAYAHIITLILIAMANLEPNKNWIQSRNLEETSWGQLYAWAFYWATTMMLTVGFGDICAINYKEAIIIVFIETLSCIIMAYNISRVGSIIANIRRQDQNRSKKFKIFKKLTDQNTITDELRFKINNYIEESSKMKKNFNFQQDKEFLKELPQNLRITYLREANRQIFNKLVFFKGLLDRTLSNFAEELQIKISHPQEIIRSIDDDFNLIILKKGHIGYICKKPGCNFNETVADQILVKEGGNPYLTSLDFISKIRPTYQIKSLRFSVLYTLQYQKFINLFKNSDMDYQLYCFLRDKSRNMPDQFEVYKCQYCQDFNHFKFTCPRLHYIPYQQHVINKELHREAKDKNKRDKFDRPKILYFTPMQYYKKIKNYHQRPENNMIRIRSQMYEEYLQSQEIARNSNEIKIKKSKKLNGQKLQQIFEQNTKQIVQIQLLKRQKKKMYEDQVWILTLDTMANFNSYFHHDNPIRLQEKFSYDSRTAKKKSKLLKLQEYKLKELSNSENGQITEHLSSNFHHKSQTFREIESKNTKFTVDL